MTQHHVGITLRNSTSLPPGRLIRLLERYADTNELVCAAHACDVEAVASILFRGLPCALIFLVWFLFRFPVIPSRNLYEVFTYNHMVLMSLRNRSCVKISIYLTRADNLCINKYIRSLLILL